MLSVLDIAVAASLLANPATAFPSAHLFSPTTSLTVERLKLRGAERATLTSEALRARLVLGETSLAAGETSRLCPRVGRAYGKAVLSCASPRLDARLDRGAGVLTVIELRGIPWHGDLDGPPKFVYDPASIGTTLSCPPATPLVQAECDYANGALKIAFQEFSAIGDDDAFAALRLGDISLAFDDPEAALTHFNAASAKPGPVRDLAALRRCELIDDCAAPTLRVETYAAGLRDEAALRIARWHAFHAELGPVLDFLTASLPTSDTATPCTSHEDLCRSLLLAALESDSLDTQARALEVYLTLADRLRGPSAVTLADAAAEIAARLGVPRFGAHLLASVYPVVPPAWRADHLLRTLELYTAAMDRAHADAIAEFAKSRLPKAVLRSPGWRQALQNGAERSTLNPGQAVQDAQVNRDIEEAARVGAALGAPQEAQR